MIIMKMMGVFIWFLVFNNGLIINYFDIPNGQYDYYFSITFNALPKIVSGWYTNAPCWVTQLLPSYIHIDTTNYTEDRHFNFIAIGY